MKKNKLSIIRCILVISVIVLSNICVIAEKNHECDHVHCEVCEFVYATANNVQFAPTLVSTCEITPITTYISKPSDECAYIYNFYFNPVLQKVKLTN